MQLILIVNDIHQNLHPREYWSINKIYQSQNQCAHSVAQWEATNLNFGCIPLDNLYRCIMYIDSEKDHP